MALKQVRSGVGAGTAAAALALLLAAPALTWGLDVPTVGSATQTVVQTTQQTTQTAVSTVDSTVQTAAPTVQTVAQPVTQTVASAPAPAVQQTTQAVTSAPKTAAQQVVARAPAAAAPASGTRTASSPSASVSRTAGTAGTVVQSGATAVAATVARHVAASRSVKLTAPASASPPALDCGTLLQSLPANPAIQSIAALICTASNLMLPAHAGSGSAPTVLAALGDAVMASLDRPGQQRLIAYRASSSHEALRPGASAASAGTAGPGTLAGFASDALRGSSALVASTAGIHHASGPFGRAPGDSATSASPTNHHESFTSPLSGTNTLTLVLIIDAAVLAGLVLWRLAQRWVIPRFA